MQYTVEIVGSQLPLKIAQSSVLENFILTKLLPEIGHIIQKHVMDKIKNYPFKNSNGRLLGAVRMRVVPEQWMVEVYNDKALAPWAIWQEKGVHEHQMRYLLNHHNPNTIPYVVKGVRFLFAGRNSKKWGAKGVRFATITSASFDQISKWSGRPKWTHPGYPGKFFYRDGLVEALDEIRGKFKRFTFRVVTESGIASEQPKSY